MIQYASSKIDFNVVEGMYMLSSNAVLEMGDRTGFNNKVLISENGFKIGVNINVNLVSVPTVSKMTTPKEVSKTAPKATSKVVSKSQPTTSRLSHEEHVLSKEHRDEMMAVSVLLIGTSLVFFHFFQ